MPRTRTIQPAARYVHAMRQLRHRQAAFVWWFKAREAHPFGMVPISTAARMLGISRTRMHNQISQGKFRTVEGMPGAGRLDRFVPIEDLFAAPFRANQGRPGLYGARDRRASPTDCVSGETTGPVGSSPRK